MRKNDKRKYLSPETEIVRFVDDIITTSDIGEPVIGDGNHRQNSDPYDSNDPFAQL